MVQRYVTNSRLSRLVIHNGVAYIAGTGPETVTATPGEQTLEILKKIDDFLQEAKTDKSKLLSAILWVKNLDDLSEINEVWDAWIPSGSAPARSCVQATPARSEFALAITVTAAIE